MSTTPGGPLLAAGMAAFTAGTTPTTSWIDGLWNGVSDLFGGIPDAVKHAIEHVFRTIEAQLSKVWAWTTSQVHHLWHDLASLEHTVAGGIGWVVKHLADYADAGLGVLRRWVSEVVNAAKAGLTHALDVAVRGLRALIAAATKGLPGLLHLIATAVPAPVRHALDAAIRWVKDNVYTPLAHLIGAEIGALRHIASATISWAKHAVSWVETFGGWVIHLLKGAEGFLLWIARYSWHEVVDIFELILHPNLRTFWTLARDSTEPLFAPIEHALEQALA